MLLRWNTAIVLGLGALGALACSTERPSFGTLMDTTNSSNDVPDAGASDGTNASVPSANPNSTTADSLDDSNTASDANTAPIPNVSDGDSSNGEGSEGDDADHDRSSDASDGEDTTDANVSGDADDSEDASNDDTETSDPSDDASQPTTTEDPSDPTDTSDESSADTSSTNSSTSSQQGECEPDAKLSCAAVYGSQGVCGAFELTCGISGSWPAESQCDARAGTENCLTVLDEDCDGDVNEAQSCPCSDNPCANGGSCVPTSTSAYSCECAEGYAGPHCESVAVREVQMPSGTTSCEPVGVSNDGNILAANCYDGQDTLGYFWNGAQGSSGTWRLAGQTPGYQSAYVTALNADGTMAAGYYTDWDNKSIPVRWNSLSAVAVTLGTSPLLGARATAMSSDGSVVVGLDADNNVLRWSGTDAPVNYTSSWDDALSAYIVPVSADGSAVASYVEGPDVGLVLWTSPMSASNAEGVAVHQVSAISNDAKKIAGVASSPENPFIYVVFYYDNGSWNFFDAQGAISCSTFGADESLSRILGWCSGENYLWIDQAVFNVQQLIEDAGSDVVIDSATSSGAISKNGAFGFFPDNDYLVLLRLPE